MLHYINWYSVTIISWKKKMDLGFGSFETNVLNDPSSSIISILSIQKTSRDFPGSSLKPEMRMGTEVVKKEIGKGSSNDFLV